MTDISTLMIRCLRESYGLEIATLQLLSLGADLNATVYKAEGADRKVYFVKIKQGIFSDAYVEVLSLLQQAGLNEIIFPIRTKEGRQVQHVGDFNLLVYPFIAGQNGFSRSLSDQQWMQFGKTLRRIHEIQVPEPVQKRIRLEDFSPKWREAVRSLDQRIEGESDEVGAKFVEFFKRRKATVAELLHRADRLSSQVKAHPSSFVLCHSDLHAGNLLLTEDVFYLVDWDDPLMAPKERDLMFIGGGVGNVWNRPHEEQLFYEGYGKTEVNPDLLAYYRHARILEDLIDYEKLLLRDRSSHKEKAGMYEHFVAMFAPDGVADIALRAEVNLCI